MLESELVRLRRELHKIPELAFEEYQTSKLICAFLDKLGFKKENGKCRYFSGLGKSATAIIAEIQCPIECLIPNFQFIKP